MRRVVKQMRIPRVAVRFLGKSIFVKSVVCAPCQGIRLVFKTMRIPAAPSICMEKTNIWVHMGGPPTYI